jgi:hypothetical protein
LAAILSSARLPACQEVKTVCDTNVYCSESVQVLWSKTLVGVDDGLARPCADCL